MRTKLMKKLNRKLTEKENSSYCLKILTQITIEKARMNWQGFEMFWQRKINKRILRQQQTYLEQLLRRFQRFFFFTKTDES